MTWERFQYSCRVIAAGKTVKEVAGADHYGSPLPSNTLPHDLLSDLEELPDAERQSLAGLYGGLTVGGALAIPARLRHIIAYMGLLALVYYWLAAIYYLRVMPSFVDAFQYFGEDPPELLSGLLYYWYLPLLLVALLLLVAIVAGMQVKSLYRFTTSAGRWATFLLPESLLKHQHAVAALLRYPLTATGEKSDNHTHALAAHLQAVDAAGMALQPELNALLRVEGDHLYRCASRYLQIVTTLVGLVLIASIFLLLASAYAPIFVLGDVL